jgi:hypothetical protein
MISLAAHWKEDGRFQLCQTQGRVDITAYSITQWTTDDRFMGQIHRDNCKLNADCYGDDLTEAFVQDVCIAGNPALDGRCFDVNCVCWSEVK